MIKTTRFRPGIETLESRVVLAANLSGGILTINGGPGADTIVVSQSGANVLVTLNSVNSLFPLAQTDSVRINGAAGADTMTYTLDKAVRVTGGDGNDTITTNGIHGGGAAEIYGAGGDDTITCNDAGQAFISGLGGDDTITAGGVGTATITGGLDDDSIACTASQAVLINGEGGNDTITATSAGTVTLLGGDGNDTILSKGDGSTIIRGGGQNDGITGGFGYNDLDGGSGQDTIKGRGTTNRLRGGPDADTFTQQGGPSRLFVDQLDSFTLRSIDTADFEPVLTLGSGAIGYVRNAPPVVLASNATVADVDSANFSGGTFRVRITSGGGNSNTLALSGGFTVDGSNNVKLNGITIGQRFSNGVGTNELRIVFSSNATKAIVQQLVRAITYKNIGGSAGSRIIAFTVSDGDGGNSVERTKTVNVT